MRNAKILEPKFEVIVTKREEIRPLLKKNMELIINNIIRIKKEKNISHEDLAAGMCSHTQHVSYILRSGKGITINVLGRMARAMDVKPYELLK